MSSYTEMHAPQCINTFHHCNKMKDKSIFLRPIRTGMFLLLCLSTIVASMAQHNKGHTLKQNSHKHKLLRTSKSSDVRKKLHELNLLELLSVPGITNPSLLETSLSPSACQFSLLENLHNDINLNCGDYRLNEKKYNSCRGPKLSENAERISSKCCRTCTQCSDSESYGLTCVSSCREGSVLYHRSRQLAVSRRIARGSLKHRFHRSHLPRSPFSSD